MLRILLNLCLVFTMASSFNQIPKIPSQLLKVSGATFVSIAVIGGSFVPAYANSDIPISKLEQCIRKSDADKIAALGIDVNRGNFVPFQDPKTLETFQSFISTSSEEDAKDQKKILSELFKAVKNKDSGNLKLSYQKFLNKSYNNGLYCPPAVR